MQDEIIEIIKKRINPKSPVLAHKTKIDKGPIIRLVMEIPLSKNRRDIPDGFDGRVLDDGYTVVQDPKRCGQHRTVSDEP
jgi:hypothetical protein